MTKQQNQTPKQNNALSTARKRIIIQAVIAIQTIIITVLLVFGMSAAWYTNVLQTSGLHFEAEAWGFDGEVFVTGDPISAAPGKSDIVGLRVTNAGKDMVDVSVRVSKDQMEPEMQKRLFFYVDATDSRNGETMERVYVNSRDSYTYTMLADSKLILTDEQSNDVPLKWEWVYDMLGYYFYGSVTGGRDENGAPIGVAAVEDYLRPVEYDLDAAVFDEETGRLEEADGDGLYQFLYLLYARDGYPGEEVQEVPSFPGYYKIDVDENGRGIWLYLCSWEEIQQATAYDSQLGIAAAKALLPQTVTAEQETETETNTGTGTQPGASDQPSVVEDGTGENPTAPVDTLQTGVEGTVAPLAELPQQFIARLILIGQVAQREYKEVSTVGQLTEQLNNGGAVRLTNTLTLDEPLKITSAERAVLDLNGNELIGPAGENTIVLNRNTDLTVMNGAIRGTQEDYDIISVLNAELTLDHVTITGVGDDAISVTDQFHDGDSTIRITNSEIYANSCAVYVRGNGPKSEKKTRIIVEDSMLRGDYITVMGNGSEDYWGTEIVMTGCDLTGFYAAVYQPQSNSCMKLVDCTVTAGTAVVVKGGDMELESCRITSTDAASAPQFEGSGFTQTGDALLVDCSYGLGINVKVSGDSVFTSQNNLALRVFVPEESVDCADVQISGGQFISSTGAIFPEDHDPGEYYLQDYVAEGYMLMYDSTNNGYIVTADGAAGEETGGDEPGSTDNGETSGEQANE